MRHLLGIILTVFIWQTAHAQDPTFILEQEKTGPGDSVRICLAVNDFENIISAQFTITWDSSILAYAKVDDITLPGTDKSNFNEEIIASGKLPFVWFNLSGEGSSLQDGTTLFCLYFVAIGELGDSSLIDFTNAPTPIEIGKIDNSIINSVPLNLSLGKVDIVENPIEVVAELQELSCFENPEGSITLNTQNGIPPISYNWEGPDGFSSSEQNIAQLVSGMYNLTVSDSIGRSSTYAYSISGPGAPLSATSTETPSGCNEANGQVRILASGGTAPYVYELNGNQNSTGVFNSLPSGDYVILVTDANNCMTDIFANIGQQTAGGETLDLGPDQLLCQGDSVTLSATGNFLTYQWFWDNQLLEANGPNLVVATEGSYRLEAQTQDGCRLSDELIVSFSRLEGSASGDTEIERGDSTQLNASNGQNYQWTPSEGLSCTDCRSPKAAPENTTTYLVDFATIDGCPASDSVVVRVTVPEDELRFEPVTFLSPNGDGQNDELYFPGLESYKSNDLNIYSRWGQLIFSKIDYQISGALWDGTLRGQPLPAGVYYYILRVDEQNITVKRNLTIVY